MIDSQLPSQNLQTSSLPNPNQIHSQKYPSIWVVGFIALLLGIIGFLTFQNYQLRQQLVEEQPLVPNLVADNSLQTLSSRLLTELKPVFSEKNMQVKISDKNDIYLWWISNDGFSIINDNSKGLHFELTRESIDEEYYKIFKKELANKVQEIMEDSGFVVNELNSSASSEDTKFYDYVQAYEKDDQKCILKISPDTYSSDDRAHSVKESFFSCTSNFEENYEEQIKYLKDLNIVDQVVRVVKRVGDYVDLSVSGRRSGLRTKAKLINGKWVELYSAQDSVSCDILEKHDVPIEIDAECLDESKGEYITREKSIKSF